MAAASLPGSCSLCSGGRKARHCEKISGSVPIRCSLLVVRMLGYRADNLLHQVKPLNTSSSCGPDHQLFQVEIALQLVKNVIVDLAGAVQSQ